MARPNTQQHSNHSDQPEQSNGNYGILLLLGGISLLIVMQTFGVFKSVESEKTTAWVDVKSEVYEKQPRPDIKARGESVKAVEGVLSEIKGEFESPVFTDIRTANEQKGWGISDDEAKFYDDMKTRYGATQNNWLGVVKRANATYKVLHDIFGTPNVSAVLQDARTSSQVFDKIQQYFGISAMDCLNFAQSGRAQRLSDWANFIDQMRH
ncbi:MAG: hypothetical protein U5L45_07170 [Saprospiraceae bacterium]|nr:hypothetical protein [Saprospiraceae bacterium]